MASFGDGKTPRIAGLAAWLAAGVPLALMTLQRGGGSAARTAAIFGAYLAFGAAFVAMTGRHDETRRVRPVTLLAVQTGAALLIQALLNSGFEGIFAVIVAAQLPFVLPMRTAIAWAAAQVALFGAMQLANSDPLGVAIQATAYGGFAAFALYAGWIAEREARQRGELSLLYAELKSTQALLAESSRLAERTRIARDLHDLLGHHLTALTLSLEVASHVTDGKAKDEVERARSLSKLLLADLRAVVSRFREDESFELTASLRALAAGIPRPEVALAVAPDLGITDPRVAEALLRIAQELVTNAAKHSGARRLTLTLARRDGKIALEAADDGRGTACVRDGHGLAGMRERIRELGGTVTIQTAPGSGFRVSIEVPA
ncbi:MAG TPA: sensor histidine kinase [Thermoanaerobaculia bacterium]|nr:sensor histidine kinase [Thermoanaerobaculia bacterium]